MKKLESKSLVLLRHHLKALRLPTIGAECEKVAQRAAFRQRRSPDLPAAALRTRVARARAKSSGAKAKGRTLPGPQVP